MHAGKLLAPDGREGQAAGSAGAEPRAGPGSAERVVRRRMHDASAERRRQPRARQPGQARAAARACARRLGPGLRPQAPAGAGARPRPAAGPHPSGRPVRARRPPCAGSEAAPTRVRRACGMQLAARALKRAPRAGRAGGGCRGRAAAGRAGGLLGGGGGAAGRRARGADAPGPGAWPGGRPAGVRARHRGARPGRAWRLCVGSAVRPLSLCSAPAAPRGQRLTPSHATARAIQRHPTLRAQLPEVAKLQRRKLSVRRAWPCSVHCDAKERSGCHNRRTPAVRGRAPERAAQARAVPAEQPQARLAAAACARPAGRARRAARAGAARPRRAALERRHQL